MTTALVTGASSGIGLATSERLRDAGFHVIGMARRTEQIPAGVAAAGVDLARQEDVGRAFGAAPLDGKRIDVLVHAAGLGDFGPLETTPLDDGRRQLEVNVVSAVDLVQRVLPGMRAAGRGRIVLVSSIAADFSSPMGAWYHASKAALESLADGLRQEVSGMGVEVSLIRPGMVRTPWHDTALADLDERVAGTPYESMGRATAAYHRRMASSSMVSEVGDVVDAVERAITESRPRTRYLVGRGARVSTLLPRVVPDRTFDRMTRAQFGIGAATPTDAPTAAGRVGAAHRP